MSHQTFLIISFNRQANHFTQSACQTHALRWYQVTYTSMTQHNACEQRSSYAISPNRSRYRIGSMKWLDFRVVHICLTNVKQRPLSSCELSPFRLPHYAPWSIMQSGKNRNYAALWSPPWNPAKSWQRSQMEMAWDWRCQTKKKHCLMLYWPW